MLGFLGLLAAQAADEGRPLAQHPDNPHYFLFRGKPAILVTSAEHYGAVINLEFDFEKYLDELAAYGLNNTRIFSGTYAEPQGAFNIARNTLAPAAEKFICPWARSGTPGYAQGGNKFDLSQWDAAYFERLKAFVAAAGQRGIVVEMVLFCPFYEDMQWKLSPFHPSNNINGLGNVARTDAHTLDKHGGLLEVQVAMTKKIVTELNEFDNLYYEICNEPYFGGVTMTWQHHIAEVIAGTEKDLPKKHLISQNIANKSAKVENPHPAVSILNFHYAAPPTAVAENFGLGRVIGDNETGFNGTADEVYRREAWEFLLAGGGLFNHLDYSFTVGHEDGTFVYPPTQPGGGGRAFRQQMKTLKDFLHGFDFVKMKPLAVTARLPANGSAYVLAEEDQQYAIYIFGAGGAELEIPARKGTYEVILIDPISGKAATRPSITHEGSALLLKFTEQKRDAAMALRRVDKENAD